MTMSLNFINLLRSEKQLTSKSMRIELPLAEKRQCHLSRLASRVKRAGVVDCFDDPDFADAVRATGRKKCVL